MPEGDTLARTARTLERWLAGRTVTEAGGTALARAAPALVGLGVAGVESRGKHLLVHLAGRHRVVVHTHLGMPGSWHVYRAGEPWRRAPAAARVVLGCGERLAVCFNAPVVELVEPASLPVHPVLGRLGPDLAAAGPDVAEAVRRARTLPAATPLGDVLLDQRVAAGIGNIWRCEALHARGWDPARPAGDLDDDELAALFATASSLLRASTEGTGDGVVGRPRARVYGRAGRACGRCGGPVRARRQGRHARTAYWCPACQPPRPAPEGGG